MLNSVYYKKYQTYSDDLLIIITERNKKECVAKEWDEDFLYPEDYEQHFLNQKQLLRELIPSPLLILIGTCKDKLGGIWAKREGTEQRQGTHKTISTKEKAQ